VAKRASVPEGKALFFRGGEAPPSSPSDVAVESLAPPEGEKARTRQSAIFLEERQIDWLEDRCREARRNGGRAIRKAAIIRALLDVAIESGVDLTGLRREEDLGRRIRQALHE
jgi:hypothetical protein